ncbi:MAG: MBL fold metallo-hydrolase [Candidatus Bathyarchaeia archaeon]
MKNTTSLTFYGGVDEIGGNKILLQDGDTRVLFDFGMSFAAKMRFYSPPYLSPKSEISLQELGILPRIKGVYKFDPASPDISAVFLSHAHLDHSAYLSFIKREVPVYCGETTSIILQALNKTRRSDREFHIAELGFKTFRTGDKKIIDNIEIEPVHVDHSVPGAYGFIIHTSNGSIVYTGDFRDHGAKSAMTRDFIKAVSAARPQVVVTEATNMTGAVVSSEAEVEEKLNQIVMRADGIVLAGFAGSDVDRLNSFYSVAKRNKRCLAVSLKQAYLMDALHQDKGLKIPCLSDDEVLIFRKSKKRFDKWEEQLIEKYSLQGKVLDVFDVSKQQCKVILALSFYDFEELVALKPTAGSCYILSSSEPFNEEMEIDHERLTNWLSHYGIPQYHVHVSGHIMPLQLKSALREMDAQRIFPIHTEKAELFAKFMRDLKAEVERVEKCKEYML